MADFNLARQKITEIYDFNVQVSEFENNYEQRRLKSSQSVIGWKIETPDLTYAQMKVYRDFFISKYGALTSFTFLCPFDNTEYTVRFVPGSFETPYEGGTFKCKFDIKKVVA